MSFEVVMWAAALATWLTMAGALLYDVIAADRETLSGLANACRRMLRM